MFRGRSEFSFAIGDQDETTRSAGWLQWPSEYSIIRGCSGRRSRCCMYSSPGLSQPVCMLRVCLVPSFTSQKKIRRCRSTYARQLVTAVTTLGDSAALLDVKQTDITTGSLDHSGSVGGGVVAAQEIVSYSSSAKNNSSTGYFELIKVRTYPLRRR